MRRKTEVLRMRPVVKKLWVDGRAGEDREEWVEVVRPTAKDATTTKARRRRCRRRGFENNDAEVTPGLLGKDEKKENGEEQGERSEQLLGDRDAEQSPNGGRVRDHPLVREEVQKRLQSARGLENPASCVTEDVRCQIGERSAIGFAACTFQVVYLGSGGPAAR